ncbi:MAG: VCBS repeat-containing protein [Candidatus Krumholzibacteriota bacterium]|nr:VCBS repeat-containing protein [Candidatus Krumholzibacteriota bacterium]
MARLPTIAVILLLLPAVVILLLPAAAAAQKWVNISYPWAFVEHHRAAEMIDDTTDSFVFGTERGILYVMERDRATGRLQTKRQREVWAPVKEIRVAEVTGDGRNDLVVTTRRGDLFVIGLGNLEDIWRTAEGYFQSIESFTVADVDGDTKPEIVLLADDHLVIMSGEQVSEEFRSTEEYTAGQVLVADVDNDGADEIVLNTGQVLDARFRQLEWTFERSFGDHMDIFDIDGDGNLEVVGTTPAGDVQIVAVDQQAVKWE